jgi:hypothetical protein
LVIDFNSGKISFNLFFEYSHTDRLSTFFSHALNQQARLYSFNFNVFDFLKLIHILGILYISKIFFNLDDTQKKEYKLFRIVSLFLSLKISLGKKPNHSKFL